MRLIDVYALLYEIGIVVYYGIESPLEMLKCIVGKIADAPTIDAELVRHGHWTDDDNCSICGFRITQKTRHYCPNCGAKMDEVSE